MKRLLLIAVAALAAVLGLTGFAATASATTTTTWYWSEYGAAHTLYLNGITWRSGVDRMRQTHCWGLGHWIVDSSGGRHFSHFYCTATPASGSQYDVVMNVTGQASYAVSFVSYVKPQTWYWPAQYTANALSKNGITWPGTTDSVTYDACSPFGPSLQGRGVYYQHFYCSIRSSNRNPYTVVVNVTDKLVYTVKWVAFDDQLPATPAAPPSVAQTATSSASGGAVSTTVPPSTSTAAPDPDCDMYCNMLRYVGMKTPPPDATSRAIYEKMLAGATLTASEKALLEAQWQAGEVPTGAGIQAGEVGCRDYANPQTTMYTTATAC
jgi:hypothetical protein